MIVNEEAKILFRRGFFINFLPANVIRKRIPRVADSLVFSIANAVRKAVKIARVT